MTSWIRKIIEDAEETGRSTWSNLNETIPPSTRNKIDPFSKDLPLTKAEIALWTTYCETEKIRCRVLCGMENWI